ncbi:MAG: transposase [Desulfuromonadales bacterium]|nr:transposase [Desulfuromonadales bacterium]MBN2792171.1 transposase [Desulfuromonadales bacterium]
MARFARLVVPNYPHHITQRGVRSMAIFAGDQDRLTYLKIMAKEGELSGVTFLSWCLMTNHVHLIAVPENEDSLARTIGEAHRRYTRMKNFTEGVRGYLFQGRFGSCVLDQSHLLAAGRYVERNPVAAGMVDSPVDYPWSSAGYHCGRVNHDPLVRERSLPEMVDDWSTFLETTDAEQDRMIQRRTKTGRPLGGEEFISDLEVLTGRKLRLKTAGRPRNDRK